MSKDIEKLYNVNEVADFFERTSAWVYWCLANGKFVYENGEQIKPKFETEKGSKRHFTLDSIQEMSLSLYRQRSMSEDRLREMIKKVLVERENLQKTEEIEEIESAT